MNNLINALTSTTAIILYIIILSAIAIYIIYYISKKGKQKRRTKHNTMELKRLVDDIAEETATTPNTIHSIKTKQVQNNKIEEPSISEVDILIQNNKVLQELNANVPSTDTVNAPIDNTHNEGIIKTEVKKVNEEIETLAPNDIILNDTEILETEKSEIETFYTNTPIISENIIETPENTNQEETLQYTTIEPQEEEAKKELELLTEKLKQEEADNINLIEHTDFEDEQEKNAIISLDELMEKAGEIYEKNEEIQYMDEGNEPISLQDLETQMKKQQEVIETINISALPEETTNIINTVDINEDYQNTNETKNRNIYQNTSKTEKVILDDFSSVKINNKEPKKEPYQEQFKNSPVISPVFGITKNSDDLYSSKTELELENTANYAKLDEEIRKTNEFLATLKELQNKLD